MVYIGTGQALSLLNIQKEQLYKLTLAGLITDHRSIGARNWRFDADEIINVLAWKPLILPKKEQAIIVHLAALRPASEDDSRPFVGFHQHPPKAHPAAALELAWVGNWPFSESEAQAAVGKMLLGDVAGWIPEGLGRRVVGFVRLHDGSVQFLVEPLTSVELNTVTKRRIKALPGQLWQRA